ncbi:methyltransferase domain-containing protein [Sulfurovum sp.]|uniref:methyltransferase domain-containing protein n=1 Tax=Sulfurovum sp. TaxID=1969726 RepID=UPI0025D8A38C|nr:methyltransferase domain-containing protein [Sulfurovum sp.]
MDTTNISLDHSRLSVEEIMQKIKEEVEKRKAKHEFGSSVETLKSAAQESGSLKERILENSASLLDTQSTIAFHEEAAFEYKGSYSYADFMQFEDHIFIRNVYRALLKREPDDAGLTYYLVRLRSGVLTKQEIIADIRFSKEGKRNHVKLNSLKRKWFAHTLRRVPVAGRVIRWLDIFFGLPRIVQEYRHYYAVSAQKDLEIRETLRSIQGILKHKVDAGSFKDLEKVLSDIATLVDLKLEKEDVDALLSKAMHTKADRSELDNQVSLEVFSDYKRTIYSKLHQKASRKELDQLSAQWAGELLAKADDHDVQNLYKVLESKVEGVQLEEVQNSIEKKADKTELDQLSTQWAGELLAKADDHDVQNLYQALENKVEGNQLEEVHNLVSTEVGNLHETLEGKMEKAALDEILRGLEQKADGGIVESLKQDVEKILQKNDLNLPATHEEVLGSLVGNAVGRLTKPLAYYKTHQNDDFYYLLFENVFYDHFAVAQKQKIYLEYIDTTVNTTSTWLDAGAGRGEFLDILTSNDIKCEGVEINHLEVKLLREKGFSVKHTDINSFLENTKKKFRGISALQVIEHLEHDYLKKMLELSYDRLQVNGIIILETINPQNTLGFANFYMDATHIKPLPPQMVAFLMEWIGFKDITIVYSALLPKELRTSNVKANYHDYAVIGYKK